jgi:hypothetical protein
LKTIGEDPGSAAHVEQPDKRLLVDVAHGHRLEVLPRVAAWPAVSGMAGVVAGVGL